MAVAIGTQGPPLALGRYDVARALPFVVVALGSLLAIIGFAPFVFLGLAGLVGCSLTVWAYRRQPLWTVLAAWVIAVFENGASSYFGRNSAMATLVKQLDEPLIIFLFIASLLTKGRSTAQRFVEIPVVIFLYAGWAGNLLNVTGIPEAILGANSGAKFFTLLFIVMRLPWKPGDVELVGKVFGWVVAIVTAVALFNLLLPGLYNALIPVKAGGAEVRFGIVALQSVFTHPDHFAAFSTLFSVWYLARFVATGERKYLWWSLGILFFGLLTVRFKVLLGFGAALGALALGATTKFLQRFGLGLLLLTVFLVLGGGIISDLAATQVDRYLLGDNNTVREALYQASYEISRDNFPFGEGFGRFGSGASTDFNSPVYEEYGLTRRGLTQEDPGVRHDTTWPTVLGEAGVLGLVAYLAGIGAIWFRLLRQSRRTISPTLRWLSLGGLVALTDVMFESLGRPAFFTAITPFALAFIVGIPLELGARERLGMSIGLDGDDGQDEPADDESQDGATPQASIRGNA